MKLAARLAPFAIAAAVAAVLAGCAASSGPAASTGSASSHATNPAIGASGSPAQPGPASSVTPSASGATNGQAIPAVARRLTCPAAVPVPASSATEGQQVPAGYQADAVVECISLGGDSGSTSTGTTYRKEVALTGLGRLVSALQTAESGGTATGQLCVSRPTVPWFVLVGPDGKVLRPRLLNLSCGAKPERIQAALSGLRWISLGIVRAPVPSP